MIPDINVNLKEIFKLIPTIKNIVVFQNDKTSRDFKDGADYALNLMNQFLINNYIIGKDEE